MLLLSVCAEILLSFNHALRQTRSALQKTYVNDYAAWADLKQNKKHHRRKKVIIPFSFSHLWLKTRYIKLEVSDSFCAS